MTEKRTNLEKILKIVNTLSFDDVKDLVTTDAVVTTPLELEMTMPEYIGYLKKLMPTYEITNAKIDEISDVLFEVTLNVSVVDNKLMHRSDFISRVKFEFEGILVSKMDIKYDGDAFDIGYLIKRTKEIFPDFEL